ncbi:MAG: caspase family protein [Burkholderiaceae bacterium]
MPASRPERTKDSSGDADAMKAELAQMREKLAALQAQTDQKTSENAVDTTRNRLALVIGNNDYVNLPSLKNASTDAKAIAEKLESAGFQVFLNFNVDERGMKSILRNFRGMLNGGDEVVFYFAGHGVQLGTANYLLPIDMRASSGSPVVRDEAIPLHRILDDLTAKNPRFSLAIIDACRNNPFVQKGRAIGGRGLAPVNAASGQMVIFSAGAGQEALDQLGNDDKSRNGVFTRVLLDEMLKPRVPIDRVVRNVRERVEQ